MKKTLKNAQGTFETLKELFTFLMKSKKWWLTPIILTLLLVGFLIFLAESSAVAPFIYTLF
jgi:hypothetical protein